MLQLTKCWQDASLVVVARMCTCLGCSTACVYAGLGQDGKRLLLLEGGPEAKRTLRVPPRALDRAPCLSITTGLVDAHLYILQRAALAEALAQRPNAASLKHVSSHLACFQCSQLVVWHEFSCACLQMQQTEVWPSK